MKSPENPSPTAEAPEAGAEQETPTIMPDSPAEGGAAIDRSGNQALSYAIISIMLLIFHFFLALVNTTGGGDSANVALLAKITFTNTMITFGVWAALSQRKFRTLAAHSFFMALVVLLLTPLDYAIWRFPRGFEPGRSPMPVVLLVATGTSATAHLLFKLARIKDPPPMKFGILDLLSIVTLAACVVSAFIASRVVDVLMAALISAIAVVSYAYMAVATEIIACARATSRWWLAPLLVVVFVFVFAVVLLLAPFFVSGQGAPTARMIAELLFGLFAICFITAFQTMNAVVIAQTFFPNVWPPPEKRD